MNIKYRPFSNICQDVSNRTGISYDVVKKVVRAYLLHLRFDLRRFIIRPSYYFRPMPTHDCLKHLSKVELKRAIRYYEGRVKHKKEVNQAVRVAAINKHVRLKQLKVSSHG